MTRLLAAAVFVVVLTFAAAPASAQYPFGGFYGGFATVYAPQQYYGYNNYGSYNNGYGYYNNNYGYSNYGYSSNGYSNRNSRHSNSNHGYSRPTTYGQFHTNGAPFTLPDGNTVSGFKNVTVLPPGYTVQGGF